MLYVVIAYLWLSLLLYLLFGGADFGAGILELFTTKKNRVRTRKTTYRAIGPIWEANHMWLIIAIVIMFVGFPDIYTVMSLYLHIPLVIMLLGIIARGTAFSFRHYDAIRDDMQTVYNRIFTWSSFITPLFLGIIAASTVSSAIDTHAHGFLDAYIFSWLRVFNITVGLFTISICAFLAAVFLIGEADNDKDRTRFISKAKSSNMFAVISGAMVFLSARYEHIPLAVWIFGNAVSLCAIIAALASLILFWYLLSKGKTKVLRILAGFQITMILLAVTYPHFPKIILLKNGGYLSLTDESGEQKAIESLAIALLVGSIFILPALFYLIYSFKKPSEEQSL
ncbi:MAG: cytochrome d ubiquinol oxidase subunit II [Arachidicoccus sp.]|nr:cytochrome d ubiquinol oxidase subunit II [Arachidicoccus sp.]